MTSPAFTLVFYKKIMHMALCMVQQRWSVSSKEVLCQPIGKAVRSVVPAFRARAVHPWGKGKVTVM